MLTPEEIKGYEDKLNKDKEELLKEIGDNSTPQNFGTGEVLNTSEDEADEAEEFSNDLATAQIFRERVVRIDEALNKIREGSYGKCQNCGEEIIKEILDAAPESRLCEKCKQ